MGKFLSALWVSVVKSGLFISSGLKYTHLIEGYIHVILNYEVINLKNKLIMMAL